MKALLRLLKSEKGNIHNMNLTYDEKARNVSRNREYSVWEKHMQIDLKEWE